MQTNYNNLMFTSLSFITMLVLLYKIHLLTVGHTLMCGGFWLIKNIKKHFDISNKMYIMSVLQFRGETVITYPWHGWVSSSTLLGTTNPFSYTVPWWNGYHISFTWMGQQFNSARDYQIKKQVKHFLFDLFFVTSWPLCFSSTPHLFPEYRTNLP